MTLNEIINRMIGIEMYQVQTLDQFHQKLEGHVAAEQSEVVDQMINQCELDNGECGICARICCPHGEPFHFHHDGCPACCHDEETP